MDKNQFLYFISFALTINTLTSLFSLNDLRKRSFISRRDICGVGYLMVDRFDRYFIPLLKRFAMFEVFACVFLAIYTKETDHVCENRELLILFFLPQILFFLFIVITELAVFAVLCYKNSFKSQWTIWEGIVEFVLLFSAFSLLELFFPTLFDFIANSAFKKIKPDEGGVKSDQSDLDNCKKENETKEII